MPKGQCGDGEAEKTEDVEDLITELLLLLTVPAVPEHITHYNEQMCKDNALSCKRG